MYFYSQYPKIPVAISSDCIIPHFRKPAISLPETKKAVINVTAHTGLSILLNPYENLYIASYWNGVNSN